MIFNYLETERDHRTSPQSDTYQDEVRTLFVSGLPSDVKQRELHLLFRAYKGKNSTQFNRRELFSPNRTTRITCCYSCLFSGLRVKVQG